MEPGASSLPIDVTLRSGATVAVRTAHDHDTDGLLALFDGLDAEARHLRFFSSWHPGRADVEAMIAVHTTGGAQLVATDPTGTIVGEAGCARLANGDGEFGITVSGSMQGQGLGPHLLSALSAVAASIGMRNLEADVLTANRPMLRVAKALGSAVIERDGLAVTRVVIGTGGRLPAWPGEHDRPRVLVEARGYPVRLEDELRAIGAQVVTCSGPVRDRGTRCPLADGQCCPLADEADAVVCLLPDSDEQTADIVEALRTRRPDRPVLRTSADAIANLLDG